MSLEKLATLLARRGELAEVGCFHALGLGRVATLLQALDVDPFSALVESALLLFVGGLGGLRSRIYRRFLAQFAVIFL